MGSLRYAVKQKQRSGGEEKQARQLDHHSQSPSPDTSTNRAIPKRSSGEVKVEREGIFRTERKDDKDQREVGELRHVCLAVLFTLTSRELLTPSQWEIVPQCSDNRIRRTQLAWTG